MTKNTSKQKQKEKEKEKTTPVSKLVNKPQPSPANVTLDLTLDDLTDLSKEKLRIFIQLSDKECQQHLTRKRQLIAQLQKAEEDIIASTAQLALLQKLLGE